MTTQLALSRRRFLEVAGIAGGGLLVGCSLGGQRLFGASDAPETPIATNAWVAIDPRGQVTITCHRNEMGQDVHTTLTMVVAEELEVDPRSVRVVQAGADAEAYTNSLLGAQITGGSTSVRDAWDPLRRAGAGAREMLVAAAAARWGVEPSACRAENGRVVHDSRGSLDYGALVLDASKRPVPAEPTLKSPDQYRVIGSALPRLDGAGKARGEARYGIDFELPGMAHAAIVACPVLGGRVVSFDAAAARSRPGVRAVVDLGEAVAVVADHWDEANAALSALAPVWDEGPAATLDDAAIAAALEAGASEPGAVIRSDGDPAASLAKDGTLSARYTTQLLAHMTLEPQNCTARVDDSGVDVWVSTQFVQGAHAVASEAAGVAGDRVRIHPQPIGGGFGRRLDIDFIEQAVEIAAAVPGTPVKLIWSREEDTTHDFYRPPSLHVLRGRVDGGVVSALEHKLVSPSITARLFPSFVVDGRDPFQVEGTADFSYAIPDLDLRTVIQEVGIRVGYWRSVSHAQNAFAIEGFLDELAHDAGADPLEMRLAMSGALPRQAEVLRRVADASGYRAKAQDGRAYGLASMQCYGSHVACVAALSGTADALRIDDLWFAVDCGIAIHPDQVVAQIEGAAVTGLIQTKRAKVTVADGRVQERNFDAFPIPRMNEVPSIHVDLVASDASPGGIGEVGTPLVAPAIGNAIFALTGKRLRDLPFEDHGVRFA